VARQPVQIDPVDGSVISSQADRTIHCMSELPDLPSLDLVAGQVAAERETMNSHAESLDTKAGVVLGFAGVMVGLGSTAQAGIESPRVW
jgi:hypothetical protein